MTIADIQNPFYKLLPETRNLFGDAPMTLEEIRRGYKQNTICGAFTEDSDDELVRRIAKYDNDAITEMAGGESLAYYENSPAFKQPASTTADEDCWYPWKTYIFEDAAKAMKGAQLTGDCTSWMVRLMLMLTLMQRLNNGALERYIKRLATAPYYANRGHRGQGSNPWRQCSYANEIGYVFEQVYGKYDLTDYKSYYRLGMSWGNGPIPREISDETSKVRPSKPLRIRSLEGWLDANRKRFPWGLGSSMGVSDVGNPTSKLQGSWNHAMGGAGYDARPIIREKYGIDVLAFMDQSWGRWNKVTNLLPEWQPFGEGMFILPYRSLERYIERGECIVYVPEDSAGFPIEPPKFFQPSHSPVIGFTQSGEPVFQTNQWDAEATKRDIRKDMEDIARRNGWHPCPAVVESADRPPKTLNNPTPDDVLNAMLNKGR